MNAELIEKEGLTAQGKRELLKHLEGETITLRQAVKAKCYDCMGFYTDGKVDCAIASCPLYPWMPFKAGGVQKKPGRTMSDEHKEKLRLSRSSKIVSTVAEHMK
ncbi:MAG: hypothetical protein WC455_17485 [Dehalococcoidia bacterium]|jgi:Zn-finger protein